MILWAVPVLLVAAGLAYCAVVYLAYKFVKEEL